VCHSSAAGQRSWTATAYGLAETNQPLRRLWRRIKAQLGIYAEAADVGSRAMTAQPILFVEGTQTW
jgi:hypothetical protein